MQAALCLIKQLWEKIIGILEEERVKENLHCEV